LRLAQQGVPASAPYSGRETAASEKRWRIALAAALRLAPSRLRGRTDLQSGRTTSGGGRNWLSETIRYRVFGIGVPGRGWKSF
jgi:hypothetical protein